MANAPFLRQIELSGKSPELRAINNEYYSELIADQNEQLLHFKAAEMRLQAEAAVRMVRGLEEIADQQAVSNSLMEGMSGSLESIADSAQRIVGQLDQIDDTIRSGFSEVQGTLQRGFSEVQGILHHGFSTVAGFLAHGVTMLQQQQETLAEISVTLSRPYDTKVQELLREGQKWLAMGAKCSGLEREENWKDALRLFGAVLDNDIGRQNYVAWFNIGYLRWKLLGNPAEAEKAFFNAQRYSAPDLNLWHTKSLRHMAQMQYLLSKLEDAYATAHRALAVQRDFETLYDTARYASKTGRSDEMLSLLDECIELQPNTIVTMFSEEDFR